MNVNIDEMISYATIAWTLAGRFKKVILTPDFVDDVGENCLGKKLTEAMIKNR